MTEDEYILYIKNRLCIERERRGTPIAFISRKTGLSYPTIYNLFRRDDPVNIPLLALKLICDALEVSMVKLLSEPELTEPLQLHEQKGRKRNEKRP